LINSNKTNTNKNTLAMFGLLFGASAWGVIWYPYRLLAEAGISGAASSFYTYSMALLIGLIYFGKHWRGIFAQPKSIFWLSLAAGWANISYVIAVIDGEVMRIMLLFYLSPLWTLLLARFWLKEPITKIGYMSIVIALAGAYIMLAGPFSNIANRWPVPQNTAEWLALSAGIGFAFANIITRKSSHLTIRAKSFAVWIGVISVALIFAPFLVGNFPNPSLISANNWLVMALIAIFLFASTILVQFGLTQLTAIRASVLFLFELVVAAIAAFYLADEVMSLNEWIGGTLIVAAALISALNHQD
jgi:drug/metabolite transporter (DMT)-like permease